MFIVSFSTLRVKRVSLIKGQLPATHTHGAIHVLFHWALVDSHHLIRFILVLLLSFQSLSLFAFIFSCNNSAREEHSRLCYCHSNASSPDRCVYHGHCRFHLQQEYSIYGMWWVMARRRHVSLKLKLPASHCHFPFASSSQHQVIIAWVEILLTEWTSLPARMRW